MKLSVIQGDITALSTNAIVNAANSALCGGGGVDGAIHRAAGPELLDACRKLGRCPTGEARITPGFKLKATHVIHAVGPVWYGGNRNEEALLASAYRWSLQLADDNACESIAFPCISTGAYRFPQKRAAHIAVTTVRAFQPSQHLKHATFCCFEWSDFELYQRILEASH